MGIMPTRKICLWLLAAVWLVSPGSAREAGVQDFARLPPDLRLDGGYSNGPGVVPRLFFPFTGGRGVDLDVEAAVRLPAPFHPDGAVRCGA